jgi:regulator of protease activity HflC (stomatin/prohibitin superfamily)
MVALIVVAVVLLFVLVAAARTIRVIPQARAGVVERLGRYSRTLEPGLTIITPFIDRVKPLVDLREQVVNFAPQSVITDDNVVVGIETVLYFTINDPRSATYEIANPLQAIEQLTVTTLRNVIGGLTLEETLTARENVNTELRVVLDEATGKWGIRINRVEIKSVDPPADIRTAMEKQMRAERDRRAAILTAEGEKQAQILTAEGEKQAAVLTAEGAQQATVLNAEGARQSAILRAEGEAKAIDTVFKAIHAGKPNRELLSYEYLQMLPQLAEGDSNKVFVVPSEFASAFGGIGEALSRGAKASDGPPDGRPPAVRPPAPPAGKDS